MLENRIACQIWKMLQPAAEFYPFNSVLLQGDVGGLRTVPANSDRYGPYVDCLKAAIHLSYYLALWHPLPLATLHNLFGYQ